MKTKAVSFVNPYSAEAIQFGFASNGCYVVETVNGKNPPITASAHATREEAFAAADQLTELPWNDDTLAPL